MSNGVPSKTAFWPTAEMMASVSVAGHEDGPMEPAQQLCQVAVAGEKLFCGRTPYSSRPSPASELPEQTF